MIHLFGSSDAFPLNSLDCCDIDIVYYGRKEVLLMGYEITKQLPSLKEALETILARCFPDKPFTCNGYVNACLNFYSKNYELVEDSFSHAIYLDMTGFEESKIGVLSQKLEEWDPIPQKSKKANQKSFNLKNCFCSQNEDNGITPFAVASAKNVQGWLSGKSDKMEVKSYYKGSLFYSVILLSNADCDSFVEYFYERFGISEDVVKIIDCASLLHWKDELVLFLTYILLGSSSKGEEWANSKLAILEDFVCDKMNSARESELVELAWLNDVLEFRPRSLQDAKEVGAMHDYYVRPEFSTDDNTCGAPIERLKDANVSIRQILVARTGMGKSMYAQMSSLSMCRNFLVEKTDVSLLEQKMPAPTDKYVVYLPAHLFSYCYNKTEYREWTRDIVELYFNGMISLSSTYNFDKRELREEKVDNGLSCISVTEELLEYIRALANAGRLVLVADAFDEIVAGKMRTAYLSALRSFYESYCNCPKGIGAHILVTSREMSPNTMENLASAIGIRMNSANVIHIEPLSPTQQQELISNWGRNYNSEVHEYLGQLNNHFFVELCSNPYMLSVVCNRPGRKLNTVVNTLINEIVKTRIEPAANDLNDDILRSVLETKQIIGILQDLAFDTLQQGCPHFSIELLSTHCRRNLEEDHSIKELGLTDEDFNFCFDVLLNLFTTAVGLIVPADGEDERFQFISEYFRYELAAAKLASAKYKSDDDRIRFCSSIVNKINDDKAYVDLIIPLICKTDSAPFNEAMVKNLVFRSYNAKNEFIVNRALVDLVMSRYGGSIIAKLPNRTSPDYYYQLCADRMLIIRLLAAPNFNPTAEEKKAILESNAFKVCEGFINDLQRKSLQ